MAANLDTLLALAQKRGLTSDNKLEIEALYRNLMGKSMIKTSCPDKYVDAIIELKYRAKMNQNKYALNNGVVLTFKGERYTNANLTDEIAAEYLELFPSAKRKFARLPHEEQTEQNQTGESQNESQNENMSDVALEPQLQIIVDDLKTKQLQGATLEELVALRMSYLVNGKPLSVAKFTELVKMV